MLCATRLHSCPPDLSFIPCRMADPCGRANYLPASAYIPVKDALSLVEHLPNVQTETVAIKLEVLGAKNLRSLRDPNGTLHSYLGLRWIDPNLPNLIVRHHLD